MTTPVLSVRNLKVEFPTRRGTLTAIDEVSFDIAPGEVLGVVGESGAGKSITGSAVIGLIEPPGRIAGGEVYLPVHHQTLAFAMKDVWDFPTSPQNAVHMKYYAPRP